MRKQLALATILALLALPAFAEEGTLTGKAHGNNGSVIAYVSMNEGTIASIEVEAPYETPGLGLPAVQTIADAIVAEQTLDVDVVTGATVSSLATIEAVENALNEGGIDTNAWRKPVPEGETVEMTADVAVVGGGFAGMVSAVRAAEQGAHVVLLERSGRLGGNARFAMGWISGAGFAIQKNLDVEDSSELFYSDIVGFAGGEENLYVPTAKYYTENSGAAIDWLQTNGEIGRAHV